MSSPLIGCSAPKLRVPCAAAEFAPLARLGRLIADEGRVRRSARETRTLGDRALRDPGLDRGAVEHAARFGRARLAAAGALLLGAAAPALAATTERVSVGPGGAPPDNDSFEPAISADGRFVAFESDATNLVPGDTNRHRDVFVHDWKTGTTERVSVGAGGKQANGDSFAAALSADGRFVAFASRAGNLVGGDTNRRPDVFVRDRLHGTTERVSLSSAGGQGDGDSGLFGAGQVAISADGRLVAFYSEATNLVPGDTNRASDIFVRDRELGTTERVSVGPGGRQAGGDSALPSLSADGRRVAFVGLAADLVRGDTNDASDAFVHDRKTGRTERVSLGAGGKQVDRDVLGPVISADGRLVTFRADADFLPDVTGFVRDDIFVHDRKTGTTERVSVGPGGRQANSESLLGKPSADGRFVAFVSEADNLVRGDRNGKFDVFVRDRLEGRTELVSVSSGGGQGNGPSGLDGVAISADGRVVAFASDATTLIPGQTDPFRSILVRVR